jgi:hypothetical protein
MRRISPRSKVRREALSHYNQPLTLHAMALGWDYYVYVDFRLPYNRAPDETLAIPGNPRW